MLRKQSVVLALLCACDALSPAPDAAIGGDPPSEPPPADLVAACPEAASFSRTGRDECTTIGCQSGFSLRVSPSSGWSPGQYRFALAIDGRDVACEGALPLKSCNEPSFHCDADGVRLGESGCALEPTQHGLASIQFEGFPRTLAIRVLRDDVELTSVELTPVYKASQPNGPGCDPICCNASDDLTLSPSP